MFRLLIQNLRGGEFTKVMIGTRDEIYIWLGKNPDGYSSKIERVK